MADSILKPAFKTVIAQFAREDLKTNVDTVPAKVAAYTMERNSSETAFVCKETRKADRDLVGER